MKKLSIRITALLLVVLISFVDGKTVLFHADVLCQRTIQHFEPNGKNDHNLDGLPAIGRMILTFSGSIDSPNCVLRLRPPPVDELVTMLHERDIGPFILGPSITDNGFYLEFQGLQYFEKEYARLPLDFVQGLGDWPNADIVETTDQNLRLVEVKRIQKNSYQFQIKYGYPPNVKEISGTVDCGNKGDPIKLKVTAKSESKTGYDITIYTSEINAHSKRLVELFSTNDSTKIDFGDSENQEDEQIVPSSRYEYLFETK